MSVEFFNYHINWKSKAIHPGSHKSDQRGMGIEFAGHSNLLDYPDPRRIDLRMTMRDPMDQVYVRIFNQRSATPIMIFNDLSILIDWNHQFKFRSINNAGKKATLSICMTSWTFLLNYC